jgi:glucan phosphoethanolaminetransferase (alkaline phosphatase superfamily)
MRGGIIMRPKLKITLKLILTILIVFLLFEIVMVKLNLREIIFSSFLFEHYGVISLLSILFGILSAYIGYNIAKKKNRDKRKWATLCFFLNFWGLLILLYLPSESPQTQHRKRD